MTDRIPQPTPYFQSQKGDWFFKAFWPGYIGLIILACVLAVAAVHENERRRPIRNAELAAQCKAVDQKPVYEVKNNLMYVTGCRP